MRPDAVSPLVAGTRFPPVMIFARKATGFAASAGSAAAIRAAAPDTCGAAIEVPSSQSQPKS